MFPLLFLLPLETREYICIGEAGKQGKQYPLKVESYLWLPKSRVGKF